MHRRRLMAFAIAGGVWGAVALLLGARALGASLLPAVAVSPLIGLSVGGLLHRRFEQSSFWPRALLALVSLFLGASLFGLAMGVSVWAGGGVGRDAEVIWESLAAVLYGTSLFLVALWPLAYSTHVAVMSDFKSWRRP